MNRSQIIYPLVRVGPMCENRIRNLHHQSGRHLQTVFPQYPFCFHINWNFSLPKAAQLKQHFFTSPEPNLSRWWTGQWLAVGKNMGNYFVFSLPGGLNRHTDSTRRSNLLGNMHHIGLFDINYFLLLCKKSIIILFYTWQNGLTQQAQGRVSLSNAIFTTEILERVNAILEAVCLQHQTFFLFVCFCFCFGGHGMWLAGS